MPYLVITTSDGRRSTFEMEPDRAITIGRASDNEVVLRDASLSRYHAEIALREGEWVLRDCDSRNGTFLDGQPVGRWSRLRPGSRISVGRCSLDYSIELDSSERITFSDQPLEPDQAVILRPSEENTLPGWAGKRPPSEDWQSQLRRFRIIEHANMELLGHDPEEVLLPKVLNLVFEAVKPERAALLIDDPRTGLICRAYRGDDTHGEMAVSRTIARAVLDKQISVLTSDARTDPRFQTGDSIVTMGVRAVMAVPLRRDDDVIGLIYVDSRMATGLFQEEDLRLLAVLANIAAIQIENARLLVEHREKIQIEQELQAAAAVQHRLLPREAPSVAGYAIDAVNVPCYEVGGDFYDFVKLDDDREGIVIADVAGKRLQAAMLMMGLHATFRAHVALGLSPDELLERLNEAMFRNAPRNRFVTLSYVELNHVRHELRWVNAGHIPAPVIVRAAGGADDLEPGNVPLGVMAEADYPVGRARLEAGDFLFMCSDGVNETVGPDGNQFGLVRLADLLMSLAGRPPEEVRQAVEERLEQHSSGTRQPDDLTIIVVQRVA